MTAEFFIVIGARSDRDAPHVTYETTDQGEALDLADVLLNEPDVKLVRIRLR